MVVINLTPHAIKVVGENGEVTFPASGMVARVQARAEVVEEIDAGILIPVVKTFLGEVEGLPAPQEGTIYLTSSLVAQAAANLGRQDVLAPDTGPTAVRDEAGRIVAVRRFQKF